MGRRRIRIKRQMDDHATPRVSLGNCFLQFDSAIAEIVGRNDTKYVGSHHAHGWPANDFIAEWAGTVAENDLIAILLNYEEITLDTSLQVDEHACDLRRI
jgi:hypothetical protein